MDDNVGGKLVFVPSDILIQLYSFQEEELLDVIPEVVREMDAQGKDFNKKYFSHFFFRREDFEVLDVEKFSESFEYGYEERLLETIVSEEKSYHIKEDVEYEKDMIDLFSKHLVNKIIANPSYENMMNFNNFISDSGRFFYNNDYLCGDLFERDCLLVEFYSNIVNVTNEPLDYYSSMKGLNPKVANELHFLRAKAYKELADKVKDNDENLVDEDYTNKALAELEKTYGSVKEEKYLRLFGILYLDKSEEATLFHKKVSFIENSIEKYEQILHGEIDDPMAVHEYVYAIQCYQEVFGATNQKGEEIVKQGKKVIDELVENHPTAIWFLQAKEDLNDLQ